MREQVWSILPATDTLSWAWTWSREGVFLFLLASSLLWMR